MKILITGGAGFLGSHLCDYLLKEGHSVICVDNLLTGSPDNIAHLSGNQRFSFLEQDVTEPVRVEGPLDGVLHFASPASPMDYHRYPIETLKTGAQGTENALDLALEKGARFMLASTSEVYGDPTVHPQREDYTGNVNTIGPRAVYDEAKRYAEALTMAYHRTHSLEVCIARIFNTYGPRMRLGDGRVIPAFMEQAIRGEALTVFGRGTQTRSFCYYKDLIEGLHRLFLSEATEPVNLGSPQEKTVLELAQEVLELSGSGSQIKFLDLPEGDPKMRRPDISRAEQLLGWSPETPLKEGLRETLKYFREVIE
jgi:dTDP-glucose 4,6-dehydratase